jgi:DNA repair protein RadC
MDVPPSGSLTSIDAAIRLFAPILADDETERLAVAYLRHGDVLAGVEQFGEGKRSSVGLPIRQIVFRALETEALAVVLAHNHPSGNPAPTSDDLASTRVLAQALKPLGIRIRDHLIRGGERWESLRALGLV